MTFITIQVQVNNEYNVKIVYEKRVFDKRNVRSGCQ